MGRILLIDANPGERLIVRSRLIDEGHEVTTAETGAKGLVEARAGSFDLIMVAADLGDGADGAEICGRLKAVPQLHMIPVVIHSHHPLGAEVTDRVYEAGCEALITKSQMPTFDRVVEVLLRTKSHHDELTEQNRVLEMENQRLDEERQRNADLETNSSEGGSSTLVYRELAAGRPDAVLVVDGGGVVRHVDRGARELLGGNLVGRTLGKVAPTSGLEAFVRDARTAPRAGFRFDVSARKDRAQRSLLASVLPVTGGEPVEELALRVVLLLDVGKRRIAEEMLISQEPGMPRQQLGTLLEAARTVFTPEAIVGSSPAARSLARRLAEVAAGSGPVLVEGERGSGKQLCARILHYSSRNSGLFLQLRCSALSPESLERELFGLVKGAFEGAVADRPGLLLTAQDGTLFLSEIAELPLGLQVELVEVLEQGSLRRRGATRREPVDCHLIASTSEDLSELVAAGRFDARLYGRLSATTVTVPALRERRDDVRDLCRVFLSRFGARHGADRISEGAERVMASYDWPGNVAELEDCVEQACRRAEEGRIEVRHLTRPLRDLHDELPDRDLIPAIRPAGQVPEGLASSKTPGTHVSSEAYLQAQPRPWDITDEDPISLGHYEMKALLRALDSCGGDKLAAARLLNVGKSTLYRKLKKFGIT